MYPFSISPFDILCIVAVVPEFEPVITSFASNAAAVLDFSYTTEVPELDSCTVDFAPDVPPVMVSPVSKVALPVKVNVEPVSLCLMYVMVLSCLCLVAL